MKVVFRTDASLQIGTGHVMRCLTLANALRERGAQCHFICREHRGHLLDRISNEGFAATALPAGDKAFQPTPVNGEQLPKHAAWLGCDWRDDAKATRDALQSKKPDWLVVDNYALDQAWEDALRDDYHKLIVIDDLADRLHTADILIDQTLGRKRDAYDGLVRGGTRLTGSDYALLRPEFADHSAEALTHRIGQVQPRHLLINFGGVDAANHTPDVLAKACDCWPGPITVVIGASSPCVADVRRMARNRPNVVLAVGSADMAGLLRDADLAIGAPGTSAWERCVMGLPTILLTCADNQRQVACSLHSAGAAISLGDITTMEADDLCRALHIATQRKRYKTLCQNAANVCDGHGTLRVIMAMVAPAHGLTLVDRLTLRAATPWDIEYLFYLQTRPGVRAKSTHPKPPSWQEHQVWCEQHLRRPGNIAFIVYNAANSVGMVRLDCRDNSHDENALREISLIIDPQYSGHGFATEAVKIAIRRQKGNDILARIHPTNKASQRVFSKAGFHYQKECNGFQYWFI